MLLFKAMITIKNEIIDRLEDRLNKLRKAFGYRGCQVKDVSELANLYLEKKLNSLDHKENIGNTNAGVSWKKFREIHFNEIYMRDKGRCVYCKKRLARDESTLDHDLPVIRNGASTIKNVLLSCTWCNGDKGLLTKEEYYYKQLHNAARGIYPPN